MLRLAWLTIRYHWDATRSTPVNFWAALLGMFVNNIFLIGGMWMMLFAGKPENSKALGYYLALNALVMLSWGVVNFAGSGFRMLATLIDDGLLETWMATPRSPLLLAGLSRSSATALGDVLGGMLLLPFVAWITDLDFALRSAIAAVISGVGFISVFILAGSISFFVERGAGLAHLLIETTLSFSVYPVGKVFDGRDRLLLYLTPAAATAILPMDAVEQAGVGIFVAALVFSISFLMFSIWLFNYGIKRYRSVNLIGARSS